MILHRPRRRSSTSACTWASGARTGCTSCARCSARCCSPTGSRSPTPAARPTRWSAPASRGRTWSAVALEAMRARGWRHEPVRVEIDKRIPVAAGLGGGSADAAAVLRLAAGELERDRPSSPRRWAPTCRRSSSPAFALVVGAGELVEPLPDPGEFAVVMIPDDDGLDRRRTSTRRRTRSGSAATAAELGDARERLRAAAGAGASPLEYAELLVNDLEQAAVSLRPPIAEALAALEEAGAAPGAGRRLGPDRGRACSPTWSPPTRRPRRCRLATRTRSSRRRSGCR